MGSGSADTLAHTTLSEVNTSTLFRSAVTAFPQSRGMAVYGAAYCRGFNGGLFGNGSVSGRLVPTAVAAPR